MYIYIYIYIYTYTNAKVVHSEGPAKQRVLQKYDFPRNLVNVTLGVSWFMSYKVIKKD